MNPSFIIGNPPYDGNLHLSILKYIIENFINSSQILWLSPSRWIQDPLADYKNVSDYQRYDKIYRYITSLDIIRARDAKSLFNARIGTELGIYNVTKSGGYDRKEILGTLLPRVVDYMQTHKPIFEENKKDGWRVRFVLIISHGDFNDNSASTLNDFGKLYYFYDGKKDNKPWWEFYSTNQFSKHTDVISNSIKFNSETEAKNFLDSLQTNFGRYITHMVLNDIHVRPEQVLYMEDYTQPWTDERFFDFFNVNEKEKSLIMQTIRDNT